MFNPKTSKISTLLVFMLLLNWIGSSFASVDAIPSPHCEHAMQAMMAHQDSSASQVMEHHDCCQDHHLASHHGLKCASSTCHQALNHLTLVTLAATAFVFNKPPAVSSALANNYRGLILDREHRPPKL